MQKILIITLFFLPFLAFGQTNTQGTTPHTLIWNKGRLTVDSLIDASGYLKLPFRDTAANQGTITVLPADSFIYVQEKGAWHKLDVDLSGYVQYADSNIVFVTPNQLQDSITANTIDTTSLSNRINQKQNISDTNTVDATRYWVNQQNYLTSEVDGSVTNELQTLSRSGQNIVLSNSGGSVVDSNNRYLPGTGIGITGSYQNQVITNTGDLSNTNELQNLSNSKTGNNVTVNISSGAGTTFSVADGDSSTTNELQTISKSGSTVTLSNSGGSFTDDNTTYTAGVGIQLTGNQFKADTSLLATNNDLTNYIPLSDKAANNGVATLDAGGKVPLSQLPASLMIYKGVWNAATNTPVLMDGVGTAGWVYKASPGGTVDLGSGPITFLEGDWAIFNGSQWERSGNSDVVTSVNGQQGDVSLTTTDIPEGTNLYFTNTRARNAISVTGSGSYNSSTGVVTINNQTQNLGLGPASSTTRDVTITNGVAVTLPSVTTSTAGLMPAADKTKLNGIADGAEVNVQPDFNQSTTTADDYIKNKPTSLPPNGAAGGDLSGTYPNPQVLDNSHNHIISNITGLQDSLNARVRYSDTSSKIATHYWVGQQGYATLSDLPTVNNGYLSIGTGTGLTGAAIFYANQSTNSSVTIGIASGYALPTNTQVSTWNGKQNALGTSTGGKYLYQDQTWKQIQYSEIAGTPTTSTLQQVTTAGATSTNAITVTNLVTVNALYDKRTRVGLIPGSSLANTTVSNWSTDYWNGFSAQLSNSSVGLPSGATYPLAFKFATRDNGYGSAWLIKNYNSRRAWIGYTGGSTDGASPTWDELAFQSDLPTVNDATISIKNGATTLGSFTTNQATAGSIDISSAIPATPTLGQVAAAGNTSSIGLVVDRGTSTSGSASLTVAQNGGNVYFSNGASAANTFIPTLTATPSTSFSLGLQVIAKGNDAGYSLGALSISARNAAGTGAVTGGYLFNLRNYTTTKFSVDYNGAITSAALAGGGNQMVTVDNSGKLGVQSLPTSPNGFIKINSNYTIADSVGTVLMYGNTSYTLSLPDPSINRGRTIQIAVFTSSTITVFIGAYPVKYYDDGTTVMSMTAVNPGEHMRITSDGTDWWRTGF